MWGICILPRPSLQCTGRGLKPLTCQAREQEERVREGWRRHTSPSTLLPLPGIWRVVLFYFNFLDGRGLKKTPPGVSQSERNSKKRVYYVREGWNCNGSRLVEETPCTPQHTETCIHMYRHIYNEVSLIFLTWQHR